MSLDNKDVSLEHVQISRFLSDANRSPLNDTHFRDGQSLINKCSRRDALLSILSTFVNKVAVSPSSIKNCKFSQLCIFSLFKVGGSWRLEMNVKELHSSIVTHSKHVQLDIGKDFKAPQPLIYNTFKLDVKLMLMRLGHNQISSLSREVRLSFFKKLLDHHKRCWPKTLNSTNRTNHRSTLERYSFTVGSKPYHQSPP